MKEMLLMRFRAVAASMHQYVFARGTMYGKTFGFASGRERPAENSAGVETTKLYQIANGILKSIDTALLHISMDSSVDTRAMAKEQYTENLLLQSISKTISSGSGHSNLIEYISGNISSESLDVGFANSAIAERGMGKVLTYTIHKASPLSVWITYTKGIITSNSKTVGRPNSADVLYGFGSVYMIDLLRACPNIADIMYGRGLVTLKLVANSGISTEEPNKTLMKLSELEDNHTVSGEIQEPDTVLLNSTNKMTANASTIALEFSVETRGTIYGSSSMIGNANTAEAIPSLAMDKNTFRTVASPYIWQSPNVIENDTLHIASVYNTSQNDSTLYIE